VGPQDVEGGRRVQLEQRENAEVALKYLDEALAVAPPAVYRAELYAHLCKCHTTLKSAEKALGSCAEHKRLDGNTQRIATRRDATRHDDATRQRNATQRDATRTHGDSVD
jgi:hypothetical protein